MRRYVVGAVVALVAALVVWKLACRSAGDDASGGDGDRAGSAGDPGGTRGGARARGARAQPAALSGRVTRAGTGEGIAGAIVSVAKADIGEMFMQSEDSTTIAVTDASGAWSVPAIAPSTYHVAAAAVGFVPTTREQIVIAPGARETIDLQLTAGGTTISGTVSDVGGGPIGGARVTAHATQRVLAAPAELVAITGPDGKYQLTLADGPYSARATHDSYTTARHAFQLQGEPLEINFTLVPGGQIRGQVVTRDGTPVPLAMVSAKGGRGDRDGDRPHFADDAGHFTIPSLGSGAIALTATARGYASPQPTVVELGIGEQVEGVRLVVERAPSMYGRVVKLGTQTGIPGVRLGMFTFTGEAAFAIDPTAEDGSFEIHGLKPGSYMIFAFGQDIMPEIGKQVEVGTEDVTGVIVEMATGVTLSGRVEPPGVAEISLDADLDKLSIDGMFGMLKVVMVRATSDATGAFTLKAVPNGTFKVVAKTDAGDVGRVPVVVEGKDQSGLVIELEQRGSIAGRVVDDRGAPMPGMRVLAKSPRAKVETVTFGGREDHSAITGTSGAFKIVGLDPGKYTVTAIDDDDLAARFARGPGEQDPRSQQVELAAAQARTGVVLTVEARDGAIRGLVVDSAGKPVDDAWVTATFVQPRDKGLPEGISFGGSASALTKDGGKFEIAKLRRGTYNLEVEGPRGASRAQQRDVKTGDSVTITLEALGTLAGKITLGGAPVPAFDLHCEAEHQRGERAGRRFASADGGYLLERLAPGDYTCTAKSDTGFATGKVKVTTGPATLDLALSAYASITGLVVGVADGKPIANLAVTVTAGAFADSIEQMLTGKGPSTDAAGRFVVDRVPPGKVELHVLDKRNALGELIKKELTVTAGQRLDVGTLRVVAPRPEGEAGTLGFSTAIDDDKLLVGVVKTDGPAAAAGVVEGDRIVAIDGRPVAQLGAEPARQLIAAGNVSIGQRVQLALERDGKPVAASVVAVKW